MTDLTRTLAEHAANFDPDGVTAEVLEHLGLDLADTLGVAIGGSSAPGVCETRAFLQSQAAAGGAQLWGASESLPAQFAAQANATAAHALDYDNTLDEGGGMHAGAPVHAAALAVADELGGVSGWDYASAVVVGLDVAVRLALAPTEDFGWHRTSAFGVFGATVAVGRLLRLDANTMHNALGIAYSQASGNRQCVADGALSKRLQAGFAARDAVVAVELARAGLTGATRVFEGKDGFFNLFQRGAYARETVLEGLGEELLSTRISLKPYPCGRNLHALIDAVHEAEVQTSGRPVREVLLTLPPAEAARAATSYPTHVVEAQFNARFVTALALTTGTTSLAAFDDPASVEQSIRPIFNSIRVEPSEDTAPGARVDLTLEDGSRIACEVRIARGNPQRPLQASDVRLKVGDCNAFAGNLLSPETLEKLLASTLDLGRLLSTNRITGLLRDRHRTGSRPVSTREPKQ